MRRRTKPTVLSIGSISTGTCRTEDIFPELLWELGRLRLSRRDRSQLCKLRREFDSLPENDETDTREDILSELYDLGQNYCPDFCYLGSHPGDGADVGVWPSEDILISGGYYRHEVADSRETATREHAHALEVNDHGNATLWRRAGLRWVEVWSVV